MGQSFQDPERNSPQAKAWRQRIIKRDKCCQMPGCKSKYRLEAHHIYRWADAPMLRYDDDNGIALCAKCHYKIRNNEDYFIPVFSDIVLAKKVTDKEKRQRERTKRKRKKK